MSRIAVAGNGSTAALVGWFTVAVLGIGAAQADSLLGIPSPTDPWRMDALIQGQRVTLDFPYQRAALNELQAPVSDEIRHRLELRRRNILLLGAYERQASAALRRGVGGMDEWRSSMDDVLLSLHPKDAELPTPLHRHRPVLALLPQSARLHVIVPESLVDAVGVELADLGLDGRASIVAAPTELSVERGVEIIRSSTRWAQDLGKVSLDGDGRPMLFVPPSRYQINDLARPDNLQLEELTADVETQRVPVFFRGGNLLTALNRSGERLLYVGDRELRNNRSDTYNAAFFAPSVQGAVSIFGGLAGASRAIVVPNSAHLYHLDLAMQPLGRNRVALIAPTDPEHLSAADVRVLASLRKVLVGEGFEIVDVPTTAQAISSYFSPVNFVQYVDRASGTQKLIVPQPDHRHSDAPAQLASDIAAAYRRAGVEILFAEDRFSDLRGGFHCAFLTLF